MKKTLLYIIFLLLSIVVEAQTVQVLSSGTTEAALQFTAPNPIVTAVETPEGFYSRLDMKGFVNRGNIGEPMLPTYSRYIELPICQKVTVEVEEVESELLDGATIGLVHRIVPQQPSRSKSDTVGSPWQENESYYTTDTYGDDVPVHVEMLGVARDRNLARITYRPARYNPVSNKVEIYTHVSVRLHYEEADMKATLEMKRKHHSQAFQPQTDLLLTPPVDQMVTTTTPVRYLIVCHSDFRGQMDGFVAWKQRKGFVTDIVYTDDPAVGTTNTSIASYIKSQYTQATDDSPAPTFLLLVGDVAQIPPFGSSNSIDNDHVTDLYYAVWTDGDILPDCYYGRFSAETADQLAPQIAKTLMYEQYALTDPSYLSRAALTAGVDGGTPNDNAYHYGDPTMDYIAQFYVNAANGYNEVTYYKNNTSHVPSGVTVTGSSQSNSTTAALKSLYNTGLGWINYTAHGSETSWSDPQFSRSDANTMSNYGMPSVMIGNCCLTNHFNTNVCLGEALLRRGDNAGAVIYIGASNSTYWEEDFCWSVGMRSSIQNTMSHSYDASHLGMYDQLFHTHNEDGSQWSICAGAMVYAGNMAVGDLPNSTSMTEYYWEIYHVMGDPSLQPWIGEAEVMPITVSQVFVRGTQRLSFSAAPYAYAALTDGQGNVITAAYADAQGNADLSIPTTIPLGSYELAVTAQNRQPFFQPIQIVSQNGSMVTVASIESDQSLNAGDTVTLTVALVNLGNADSQPATLACNSDNLAQIQVLSGIQQIPAIAAGDTLWLTAAFTLSLNSTTTDGTAVGMTFVLTESDEASTFHRHLTINAPHIVIRHCGPTETVAPDTTITYEVVLANNGHADLTNATLQLSHIYGLMEITPDNIPIAVLQAGDEQTFQFTIHFASTLPHSYNIPMTLLLDSPQLNQSYPIGIDYNGNKLIDFETGAIDQISATFNSRPWFIDSTEVHSGRYAIRSAKNISSMGSSQLKFSETLIGDDSIRFFVKTSTEANGDYLMVYIDREQKLSLSGISDWTYYAFPLSAGYHTFEFTYKKDWSATAGEDAVWLDDIHIGKLRSDALFTADTICQGDTYTVMGESVDTDTEGTQLWVDDESTPAQYVSLTVIERPQVAIIASAEWVTAGTQVLLCASGASRYEWNTGESSQEIEVRPEVSTTYQVTGYQGTCSAIAEKTIQVGVGIESVEQPVATLYPNPAKEQVTVSATGMRRIILQDLKGRVLYTVSTTTALHTIPLDGMAHGIYLVTVETGKERSTMRLVVL